VSPGKGKSKGKGQNTKGKDFSLWWPLFGRKKEFVLKGLFQLTPLFAIKL
jgi:hypothetical protein